MKQGNYSLNNILTFLTQRTVLPLLTCWKKCDKIHYERTVFSPKMRHKLELRHVYSNFFFFSAQLLNKLIYASRNVWRLISRFAKQSCRSRKFVAIKYDLWNCKVIWCVVGVSVGWDSRAVNTWPFQAPRTSRPVLARCKTVLQLNTFWEVRKE